MVGLNRKVILTVKLFRSMVHVYIPSFSYHPTLFVCILFGMPSFTFFSVWIPCTTMTSLLFHFHVLLSTTEQQIGLPWKHTRISNKILETLRNPFPKPWQQCLSIRTPNFPRNEHNPTSFPPPPPPPPPPPKKKKKF